MSGSQTSKNPLAVVGMACRLPGASNLEEFWSLLMAGKDASSELPEELFNRSLYFDPRKGVRGKSYSSSAALEPRLPLDHGKCQLPEKEIHRYDPCHLTMCEIASDAIRDAGMDPRRLAGANAGVYFGHTGGSALAGDMIYASYVEQAASYLRKVPAMQELSATAIDEIAAQIVQEVRERYDHRARLGDLDLAACVGARLIAQAFGLDGPCAVVDAACASSTQAIALAARSLQQSTLDMAIVGGASCYKTDSLILFSQAQSVTADASRPFDAEADGLMTAEGYVVFVLKTLSKAIADGNPIRCVIRGIGTATDGKGKSLWAPLKEGQSLAIRRAYPDSIRPEDVQFIEAHATSTQVGDATELAALADILPKELPDQRKIFIGGVKGNIGHTLETAGAAGLAKTILSMERGTVPPNINLHQLNPKVPWDTLPFDVPVQPVTWNRPKGCPTRLAAVNSFGIGGLNVHVLLEEYRSDLPLDHYGITNRVDVSPEPEPIAIVGTGIIVPAHDTNRYWELLQSGEDVKTEVTPDRWDADIYHSDGPYQPFRTGGKRGGFLTDYRYDWRRHKVPPKQVERANPLQFALLDAAGQALRDGGYQPGQFDTSRIGVVVGTIFGGDFSNQLQMGLRLPEFCCTLRSRLRASGLSEPSVERSLQEIGEIVLEHMPALLDETGSFTSSTLASRITKTFDLKGGALSLDAGAASGLAALSACAEILRGGESDAMICAAGQRSMDMTIFEGLSRNGCLASGSHGPNPDQWMPGEGSGVLLLKRFSDAQRDGNRILALVRGVGASSSFYDPVAANLHAMERAAPAFWNEE